ncbi:hypothetical protein RHMOL_Rhmol09G0015000 [Rhododendron molle]|uniref:Uncharacterized protein n=1 Tax=Rhododendron molle TaxID=49168 RepID=A0ACC0M8N5_RHOML|nr:hypothetical protein RHMOL_Rhmol09G0015000 [Rhododendron molle]
MGRVKLKIQRLDSSANRLTTYSKRKNGLVKKAEEISVLCDIDIAVLITIEGIVRKFAATTPHERVKRKLETVATLRRVYKNSDHEMLVLDYLGSSHQSVEDMTKHASSLRTQLSEIQQRLSDWTDLDKIDSVDFLEQMVAYTGKSLAQIQEKKENIGKQQFSAQGCHYQSPNGDHLRMSLDDEQQARHCSWVENDGSQPKVSPEEMLLLSQRENELSAGNSLANYTDYLGVEGIASGQKMDIQTEFLRTEVLRNELIGLKTETLRNQLTKTQNLKNEMLQREPSRMELHNIEFLSNEVNKNGSLIMELKKLDSMRNELIETTTLANVFLKPGSLGDELIKTESLRNQLINTTSMGNELHEPESLRLQLCEQDSYPLHNFETQPNQNFEPVQQMNLEESIGPTNNRLEPVQQTNLQQSIYPPDDRYEQTQQTMFERRIGDFCDEGNSDLQLGYSSNHCSWAPTSGPFVADTFDEHLYTQASLLAFFRSFSSGIALLYSMAHVVFNSSASNSIQSTATQRRSNTIQLMFMWTRSIDPTDEHLSL